MRLVDATAQRNRVFIFSITYMYLSTQYMFVYSIEKCVYTCALAWVRLRAVEIRSCIKIHAIEVHFTTVCVLRCCLKYTKKMRRVVQMCVSVCVFVWTQIEYVDVPFFHLIVVKWFFSLLCSCCCCCLVARYKHFTIHSR